MYALSIILLIIGIAGIIGSFIYALLNILNDDFDSAFKKHIGAMIAIVVFSLVTGVGFVMLSGTFAVDAFHYVDENIVQELTDNE